VAWLDGGHEQHSAAIEARGPVTISWSLKQLAGVEARIFDLAGREARLLFRGVLGAGSHAMQWDGRLADGEMAAPGWYFVRITGGVSGTARFLLLR
jgi:flagellar hook assembly protein FlgD